MKLKTLLLLSLLLVPNLAHAQEDLLWKAENSTSPTLVPEYLNWVSPFRVRSKDDIAAQQKAQGKQTDADKTAQLAAQQQALDLQKQASAEKRATAFLAKMNPISVNLASLPVNGVMQGPQGSSLLSNGKWFPLGTQFRVPTATDPSTLEIIDKVAGADTLTGSIISARIQKQLTAQPAVSVTLVEVTSASAVFSDGRKKYTAKVSQFQF